ncbi:hypothetical protein SDC9_113628 [bioreactor metagenome]|uniref:Cupin 2 conserved barrel domain-containing protein n=1 Tax=bioreactor metagenome TaxID=1076179 RepID=A0A645BNA4_9ZZZZ|nr:cupin domain-containing protein [Proteiniclasticum sp. QWL-01]UUM12501.1 cupin domain-containing protein [Clostridiaceae bacterium HFYG-1003]WFF74067.1 cupin domain-containing protein [Proteiniclasticum sp. QWL-01]
MIETVHSYSLDDEKKVEKIIDADEVMINHMIFPKGAGLPEHFSNSNVYMTILRGTLTLQLGEQEAQHYPQGSIINIPYNTKMNVSNAHDEVMEMFVIKAPNPRVFQAPNN